MKRGIASSIVLSLVPALLAFQPASAASDAASYDGTAGDAQSTQSEQLIFTSSADVALLDNKGRVIESQHYDADSQNQWLPAVNADTDQGAPSVGGVDGTSSASGCGTVTVHNVATTLLGFTAYHFDTWTYWCWKRWAYRVYNIDTGWRIHDVDSQQYWRGIIAQRLTFFEWVYGQPYSGYLHVRQGQFDNCVLKYGCIGTTYPENTIRTRSDGTWYWAAVGT